MRDEGDMIAGREPISFGHALLVAVAFVIIVYSALVAALVLAPGR